MKNNAKAISTDAAPPTEWFGHPKGLTFLFATEMWERFSYYGMRALLVLYMVDYLLKPERAGNVIGLDALKRALEALAGPLGAQPLASHIYGLYTGFVYLTPILGGLLADRWLGRRITVALGAALMVAGHFMMASESLFLFALLLLIVGNGAFKPNIVTQLGGLYPHGDTRRDRAYSIFYVGINIGAFFSPLVAGTLGETVGWHYGFASAGVGMAVGLAIYAFGLPPSPARTPAARDAAPRGSEPAPRAARRRPAVSAGDAVLGLLRAAGQHHRAMGAGFHRPPRRSPVLARRNSRHLVPGVQSADGFPVHAAAGRLVDAPRAGGPRAADDQ